MTLTAFVPATAVQAIALLEAAGVPDARRLLADYAAAGLTRSYALVIETAEVDGCKSTVRAAAISADIWKRIIRESATPDVWSGGTVRLAASELIGGAPAVSVTGIGFHEDDLDRMVEHHVGRVSKAKRHPVTPAVPTEPVEAFAGQEPVAPMSRRKPPNPAAIPPGAIFATIKQTEAALGCSHTTIYKLVHKGALEKVDVSGMPRITVASIMALAGADA